MNGTVEPEWLEDAQRRVQLVLENAEQGIDRDVSRVVMWIGASMVVGGFVAMALDIAFAFSLTQMVWGAILAVAALIVSHKKSEQRVEATKVARGALTDIVALRVRHHALVEFVRTGVPEGWSSADVELVLGGGVVTSGCTGDGACLLGGRAA